MTHFKQALLDELVAHAERPAPAPQLHRPVVLLAAAAAVVVAAVVGVLIVPFGESPAYAVVRNPDGTVTITFRELADPEAATRDLRAAGVPAMVVALSDPGSCAAVPAGGRARPAKPISAAETYGRHIPWPTSFPGGVPDAINKIIPPDSSRTEFTIRPDAIPTGAVVFILQDSGGRKDIQGLVSARLIAEPAPACWEYIAGQPHRPGARDDGPVMSPSPSGPSVSPPLGTPSP